MSGTFSGSTRSPAAPVETKVKVSTVASYLGALVLTALANSAQDVDHALVLGALPEWLESLLLPLLPAAVTFVAGYLAKHTHRPDLGGSAPAGTGSETIL